MELLRKTKVKKELRKAKRREVLNIQSLAIRLLSHSSSSLECVKEKAYNAKIQFAQTIIQDIDLARKSTIEFLRKSKRCGHAREQIRLGATSIDLMYIEESEEDEVAEHHFLKSQIM